MNEDIIIEATKDLLFRQGKFAVTSQDISNVANLNRTSINYYFRSKENLFQLVINDMLNKYVLPRYVALLEKQPLKTKIINFIDSSFHILKEFPYLDLFMLTNVTDYRVFDSYKVRFQHLLTEIQNNINKEKTKYELAIHFLTDLLSLVSYPFIAFNFFEKTNFFECKSTLTDNLDNHRRIILEHIFI